MQALYGGMDRGNFKGTAAVCALGAAIMMYDQLPHHGCPSGGCSMLSTCNTCYYCQAQYRGQMSQLDGQHGEADNL